MKFIKKSFLVLSLLSFFSLSSFSANACTVKVGDFDWDSANIHTAIGSYIMEHGYGCDVEVTKGSTNPILAALIDNQLDIIFEHWTDNNVALIDPELASGNLVDLGINTPASEQAFFVDRATSEAHGITSVDDLKKPGIWELFKDPEDPSKGRITSCISGWTCYTINLVKIMEYGLGDMYTNFDQGSDEVNSTIELLRPHGMGTVFKVLIQHKSLEVPTLQALRHRPFFEHVLTPAGCGT